MSREREEGIKRSALDVETWRPVHSMSGPRPGSAESRDRAKSSSTDPVTRQLVQNVPLLNVPDGDRPVTPTDGHPPPSIVLTPRRTRERGLEPCRCAGEHAVFPGGRDREWLDVPHSNGRVERGGEQVVGRRGDGEGCNLGEGETLGRRPRVSLTDRGWAEVAVPRPRCLV